MTKAEEILNGLFVLPASQDWFKPVLKAMDEYARQEAISALKFARKYYDENIFVDGDNESEEQLYDLYLKSRT